MCLTNWDLATGSTHRPSWVPPRSASFLGSRRGKPWNSPAARRYSSAISLPCLRCTTWASAWASLGCAALPASFPTPCLVVLRCRDTENAIQANYLAKVMRPLGRMVPAAILRGLEWELPPRAVVAGLWAPSSPGDICLPSGLKHSSTPVRCSLRGLRRHG